MTTIDDINRQIQQEKESYSRNLNRLQQEILNLKQRHQRNMANLQEQKERIKQQNLQLESYNMILYKALGI